MKNLTHTDGEGRAVMVDVGGKEIQHRIAKAAGSISMKRETIRLIKENLVKKGDVLTVAELAGINAAKQTGFLIPLCHNIPVDKVSVRLSLSDDAVLAESEITCTGRTGVEMEALTAVSISLLTVYDMCKAVDKEMVINQVRLTEKQKR
jgi:cyclic pyranopterin monophosphate synthase